MWIRVPVHCQCRGHCPLRQPCHRAKVGCQSRCQCVAAVTVPRERDERCPRGLCLPVGYCASTPGYPNSGIPAGIRNQESDSGMGPTRSRFLIPVPSQSKKIRNSKQKNPENERIEKTSAKRSKNSNNSRKMKEKPFGKARKNERKSVWTLAVTVTSQCRT